MLARRGALSLLMIMALASLPAAPAQSETGFAEVQAIFDDRCVLCHSGPGAPLGLTLDSYEGVTAGSERGPVVVPGEPEASELVHRIRGTSEPRMPLTGPPFLSDEEIELIVGWIAGGARGPVGEGETAETGGEAQQDAGAPENEGDADRQEESPPPAGADGEGQAAEEAAEGAPVATWEAVEAIVVGRCAKCHSDGGLLGAAPEGLRLGSYEQTMAGGERVVVVPFEPLASELYRKVVGLSLPRMPLDGPPYLSQGEIDLIRAWIEAGAGDAAGAPAPLPLGGEVRLRGTLTGRWELDGLPLRTGGETRFDDEPGVGDYVEVRGVVRGDGTIDAERIRTR